MLMWAVRTWSARKGVRYQGGLGEGTHTLQNLEVLDIRIVAAGVELDLGHGHVHEYAVKHLAERGAAEKLRVRTRWHRSGVVRPSGGVPKQ